MRLAVQQRDDFGHQPNNTIRPRWGEFHAWFQTDADCVKVVDTFGCDTSITVEVKV